jgi:hypothetical protein
LNLEKFLGSPRKKLQVDGARGTAFRHGCSI